MKKTILAFIIGIIVTASITVYATVQYQANEISYGNGTVKDALDDLYINGSRPLSTKLTDINTTGQVTITGNTQDTLYVALFSYTSYGQAGIINARTTIASVTGATYTELFNSYKSFYGIRLYKLTNCEDNIQINSNTSNSAGNIIVFY